VPATSPPVDQVARDGITKLATQSRELQDVQQQTQKAVEGLQTDVAAVRSQVSNSQQVLSEQLRESHESTRSEFSTITERLQESIAGTVSEIASRSVPPEAVAPVPDTRHGGSDISTEIKTGPTASKWWSVLSTLGRTGLAIAAPEVAIPGGIALSLAGAGLAWILQRRKARASARATGTSQTDIVERSRVIPIAVDAAPTPQLVTTETHFVPFERDSFQQAHAWAKEQLVRKYPGSVSTVETLDSLISQHLEARKT
jgi:hypothetical protein